jgi:hypothetical protein
MGSHWCLRETIRKALTEEQTLSSNCLPTSAGAIFVTNPCGQRSSFQNICCSPPHVLLKHFLLELLKKCKEGRGGEGRAWEADGEAMIETRYVHI